MEDVKSLRQQFIDKTLDLDEKDGSQWIDSEENASFNSKVHELCQRYATTLEIEEDDRIPECEVCEVCEAIETGVRSDDDVSQSSSDDAPKIETHSQAPTSFGQTN